MGNVFARGQSPYSFLHVAGLVCRFPLFPCLCRRVETLPLVRGSRVRARFRHRVCPYEEEGCVRDWVINRAALVFLLGGLECVYVLENAFDVRVILLHLVMEREDVDCVQSAAD